MSTKTSIKRIALVAVSALGFGLLSSGPSSAAVTTARTVVPAAATVTGGYVGTAVTTTIGLTTLTGTDAAEVVTLTPTLVSSPAGSAVTVGAPAASKVGLTSNVTANTAATATLNKYTNVSALGVTTLTFSTGTVPAMTAEGVATLSLTADRQGKYVVSVGVASSTGTGTSTAATVTFWISDLYGVTADGLAAGDTSNTSINGVAGVANTVVVQAVGGGANRLVTVSGAGATIASAGAAFTVASGGGSATTAAAAGLADATMRLTILTPTAGTVTVSIFTESQPGIYSATARGIVTITVASSASNGTIDAANSTATLSQTVGGVAVTNGYLDADVTTKAYAPRTANVAAGKIVVSIAPVTAALSALTSSTISVTGPGLVGFDMGQDGTGDDLGRSVTRTTGTDGAFDVIIYGDGTSGTSTVTVTTGAFTKSFTMVFFGSVASYSLTAKNKHIAVGVTDTQVVTVAALDSAGVAVPNAAIWTTSSAPTVGSTAVSVVTGTDGTAANVGIVGVSAGAVTLTFANAASSATVTNTYSLDIVKAGIASVALSFDKASYEPGEKAVITVTAKNADGAPVGDATYANLFSASGIVGSAPLQGYTATSSVATTSGAKTYTVYMPLGATTLSISATLGADVATAIQLTSVTASAVVTGGPAQAAADAAADAAAEAIDAANAATDAANLAAEAADAATVAAEEARDAADAATAAVEELATQVATLMAALKAQITTLANTVAKIAKKVKA